MRGMRRSDEGPTMVGVRRNCRQILAAAASAAAAAAWPHPVVAQTAPRIVIVGGGFAGASCARALREVDPRIAITLVEARRIYTAPPLSNGVLGGIRTLGDQQFTYDKIAAAGIKVAIASATGVDPQTRSVTLSTGDRLPYDRLVLAPGIDFRWDAIAGYGEFNRRAIAPRLDGRRRANRIAAPSDRGDG